MRFVDSTDLFWMSSPTRSESVRKFFFWNLKRWKFVLLSWAQNHIAQALYWHDPIHEQTYRLKSTFLADINNERRINEKYRKRLNSLQKFVMVKFLRDKIVTPIETSWFGFFESGSDKKVLSLRESSFYASDKLGLKQMMKEGKLVFMEVKEWFLTSDKLLLFGYYTVNFLSGRRRTCFISGWMVCGRNCRFIFEVKFS